MTNQSTTTKEALEHCPLAHPIVNGVRFTNFSNNVKAHIWCYDCGLEFEGRVNEPRDKVAERWNSRVFAPVVDIQELQRKADELPAACEHGNLDPRDIDRLIEGIAAAPAATVASQQSDDDQPQLHAETCDRWVQCGDHVHYEVVVNCSCGVASPAALRDEAVCKCGLDKDDPIHSFSTERQQMHSFTPKDATTPPSTPAKAAAGWLPIETAPKDEPVWLFGSSLIDEDYNRKGVVEGYWLDDLGWMGAIWNNEQDYWESHQINPTHWMPTPPPPTEIQQ